MPLFRRREPAVLTPPETPIPQLGTLPCSESGCEQTTGVPCSYMDRRFHGCDTAWCSQHGIMVSGKPYCRRHAGTVRALLGADETEAAPDVDCRAASLVAWVASDMDPYVRTALDAVKRPGEEMRPDTLRLVFEGRGRHRVWEYAWKLAGHGGFGHWVSFRVAEELDDHVDVFVDSVHVYRSVPPWITNRREGRELGRADDDAQRAAWYAELVRAIRTELVSRGR